MLVSIFVPECGTMTRVIEAETVLKGIVSAVKDLGFRNIRVWEVVWGMGSCNAKLIVTCKDDTDIFIWTSVPSE